MPYEFSKDELDRISSNSSLYRLDVIFFYLENKLNANQKEKILRLIMKTLSVSDKKQKVSSIFYY